MSNEPWVFGLDRRTKEQVFGQWVMSNEKVGTLRAAAEVFTHANPANPAKGLEQNFVRFVGFAWDYNSCVLFGRCTQTSLPRHPSVTTNMLFAVFEYKGLWPDNRKHVLLFFCRKTHDSSLTTHCSKCSFVEKTHSSQLTAHNSPLKTASTVYKTTNLLSDNQKVALSLGRSGRNRYFCNNKPL